MGYVIPILEFVNYILFSIVVGHVALQFIPKANKPKINMGKPILLLSILGIMIFTLGPVIQVIFYFEEGVGFALAAKSVLLNFQVGKAWIFIGCMSTLLWITIYREGSKYLQALLLLLMIVAIGYSSHAASLSFWTGLFFQSTHFLMVTLWIGILIHVAWFSMDQPNWSTFLRWFTPLAAGCLLIIIVSGICMMLFMLEPKMYVKAWVFPYGQMLLIKHISIIPVLVFAFINGVLAKKSITHSSFQIRPWMKGESILLCIVFYVTSVLGTLSPPHDVEFTVKSEGASKWVEGLVGKKILSTIHISVMPSFQSLLFIMAAILFLILILFSFKKRRSVPAILFGVAFIIILYMGLMLSLTI